MIYNILNGDALAYSFPDSKIAGDIIDIYPSPAEKKQVTLKYAYLKKLSGKEYEPVIAKNILSAGVLEGINYHIKLQE